jgi:hypothetical protein
MLSHNPSEQHNMHILPYICGFCTKSENYLYKRWKIFSLKIENSSEKHNSHILLTKCGFIRRLSMVCVKDGKYLA